MPLKSDTDCALKIYVGSISHDSIKEKVENAKLILSIGALKSDFNTGNFTYHIPVSRTVEVRSYRPSSLQGFN